MHTTTIMLTNPKDEDKLLKKKYKKYPKNKDNPKREENLKK